MAEGRKIVGELRKTFIVVFAFLCFSLSLFFVAEMREEQKKSEMRNALQERLLWHVLSTDIQKIIVRNQYGEFVLERATEGETSLWHLTHPMNAVADRETIESILTMFVEIRQEERLQNQGDLANLGLAPPQAELQFFAPQSSASEPLKVALGRDFPAGNLVYAQRGENLFAVRNVYRNLLDRPFFSWRDIKLFRCEGEQFKTLKIAKKEKILEFLARDGKFFLRRSGGDKEIPMNDISKICHALESFEWGWSPDPFGKDPQKYNLAPPLWKIDLNGQTTIELGEARGTIFFKIPNYPEIGSVRQSGIKDLERILTEISPKN